MVWPKVSIIIPTFEALDALKQTLESVVKQRYDNLELIIIDGGSRDGTATFLKQWSEMPLLWKSEADTGISDAFNKGVRLSTGDYLYFLGAGDTLYDTNVFEQLLRGCDKDQDILICGRVCRFKDGQRIWVAPKHYVPIFDKRRFRYHMALPHQGLLMHRQFFDKYGLFDTDLRYAMDYELLLRAYHDFPKTILKPQIVAVWAAGGVGADHTLNVYQEYLQIKQKHAIASKWWLRSLYYWHCFRYKIMQLVRRRSA